MSKQVIFAYIKKFMCLQDVNLNFCPNIRMEYNQDSKILSVDSMDFPDNFFPNNIASVATIVGENGSGKTSVLLWLLKRIIFGYDAEKLEGIIAISDNGKIKVFHDVEIANCDELKAKDIETEEMVGKEINERIGITTVVQTSGFDILREDYINNFGYRSSNPLASQVTGEDNISDMYRLVHDLQNYRNHDTNHFSRPLQEHVLAYDTQNNLRICLLILDSEFRKIINEKSVKGGDFELKIPPFIYFSPNTSARFNADIRLENLEKQLKDITEGKIKVDDKSAIEQEKDYISKLKRIHRIHPLRNNKDNISTDEDKRINVIDLYLRTSLQSFFYNLLNLDFFNFELKKKLLDEVDEDYKLSELPSIEWVDHFRGELVSILGSDNLLDYSNTFFSGLRDVLSFLYNKVLWEGEIPYLTSDIVSKNEDIVDDLVKLMKNKAFLTERFFDLHYSHNLKEESRLSGGELSLLNLFSRIREAWTHQISPSENNSTPSLLILDEAEVGYHPEWQRRFINELLNFMSCLANEQHPVQIIYTTHSPITLSDMPEQCVNLLKNQDNITRNVKDSEIKETFGANIFDLYGNSFFMKNGLIGEFAAQKIRKLSFEIEELVGECGKLSDTGKVMNSDGFLFGGNRIHNLRSRIDMIGDERIRAYLNSRLDMADPNEEIRYLKERLAFLEQQFNNTNEKD